MTEDKKISSPEFPSVVTFTNKNVSNVVNFMGNSINTYIVLEGNLSEGWIAFGPFDSFQDANFFANSRNGLTWVMELNDVEPPQKPAMA